MPVTKQTYTLASGWTETTCADLFKQAFIDAGWMADWYDEFSSNGRRWAVLEVIYDASKTWGKTYYVFSFNENDAFGLFIASGWNASTDSPTGTQFVDYHCTLSQNWGPSQSYGQTILSFDNTSVSTSSAFNLYRYTSATDTKQSWFVVQQGTNRSRPFTILHKNATRYPWIDLDKGVLSGLFKAKPSTNGNNQGWCYFALEENIRRALLIGSALNGHTDTAYGGGRFHGIDLGMYSYGAVGKVSASDSNTNRFRGADMHGKFILPTGIPAINNAYSTTYTPICSELPFNFFSPDVMASDFGLLMQYGVNTISFQDRFVVTAGTEEWEVMDFTNNSTVTDGISPVFLARVV